MRRGAQRCARGASMTRAVGEVAAPCSGGLLEREAFA